MTRAICPPPSDLELVKIADFGVSKEMTKSTNGLLSQQHALVGTLCYCAPEELAGGRYDFKSDIYSLGCILYELLCLRRPFREEASLLIGSVKKIW